MSAPGWRDPRLWIGVAIVAASVVLGARLVGAADESVTVWAAADDLAVGQTLTADDLVAQRVRFVEDDDLERYLTAEDQLPAELRVTRVVGSGELLPRAAVGGVDEVDTMALPVAVDPALVPPGVTTGWVVDVYVTGAHASDRPVLTGVTVLEAPPLDELLAVGGQRQVVLGVGEDEASAYFRATAGDEPPVLTIVRRG